MIRSIRLRFLLLAVSVAGFRATASDDFYDATGYYDTFGSTDAPVPLETYGDSPTAYYNSDGSVYYRKTIDGIEWQYTISDGKVSVGGGYGISYESPWYRWAIRSYSPETITMIAIPATIDDCPVVGINGYAFGNCENLVEILIPDSVTSIEDGAFFGGSSRFSGCSRLTSLTIPNSVTKIGSGAFANCSGLTSVTADPKWGTWFSWATNLTFTIPDGVTSIGKEAFYGCSGLTSITIPDSVTSIGERAFTWCSGLTSVTIPDGVTSIGNEAFSGCSGLTSITISDGMTSIGSSVFAGCSGLTSITIPDSVTTIEGYAFYGCDSLFDTSTIPGVRLVDGWAVGYESTFSGMLDLTGIRGIGERAFTWCSGLTSVAIPDSVTSIEDGTFSNCSGLMSVTIPNSVTNIGEAAFYNCSGLTSITIPDSVTSIGRFAFESCSGLTSVTIPGSVTSIGDYAFSDCSGLKTLYLPRSYAGSPSRLQVPVSCRIIRYDKTVSFSVASSIGTTVPGLGNGRVVSNVVVSCSVPSPVEDEEWRYICTGWRGMGSVPASGTSNRVDVLMLEDSSIEWLWETNVWIECEVTGDATFSGTGRGWFRKDGVTATFSFVPTFRPFLFRLSGDADGVSVDSEAGTVSILADRPRSVELRVLSLDEAIKAGGKPLDWSRDAEAPWFAVADGAATDGFALQSGEVSQGGTSALQTTVTGPGRLSFAWRLAANGNDFVRFYVDDAQQAQISRETTAWATNELEIAAGQHILRWTFECGSAVGGAGFLDDVRWTPLHAFTVASAAGTPTPAVGTHDVYWGTEVATSVATPEPAGGTRHVCTDWTGTGSVPASGTGTNVAFTVEEDSSLTWNWRTEHWIDVAVASGGWTWFEPQWVAEGETIDIYLSPNWSLYDIALSGDTNGVMRSGSTLHVPADVPRTIRATIAERKVSLTVFTPMGEVSPAPGTHLYSYDDCVTATAVSPLREENGEQVVCTGWTGIGSVPASGTSNMVNVLMIEDSSIAWLWDTNVWIECAVSGKASPVGAGSGWFRKDGESAVFAFAPTVRPFSYVLSGDADGVSVDSSAGTIAIPADRPRAVGLQVLTRGEAGESGTGKPLSWSDSADAPWFAVADDTRPDGFRLQSGDVAQGGTSALETTVSGPGRISFDWKIAANRSDYARFYVDGEKQTEITRSADWAAVGPIELGAGEHVLRWAFERGSAAGGAAFLDDVCWQPRYALMVSSTDGAPSPAAGTHDVYWGTNVAANVAAPAPSGGTRRACTGWTGTGSVPESGSGTNVTFTVEADSTLTWNWRTEHWIDVAVESGGTTAFQPQWTPEGTTLSIALSPDWTLYDVSLSGDTDGVTLDGTTLSVTADKPRTIRVAITERKVSLTVSSVFGTASPTPGTHVHSWGDTVTASVAAPPEVDGTRRVCLGWTGTGSVPAGGSGTSVSFTMREESTLAWNWRTDHWISLEKKGPVEADFAADWRAAGTTLEVAFEVFWEGDCDLTLGGDTNGVVLDAAARTIAIPCDGPRDIVLTAQPTGLATALDAPKLVWTSEGDNAWTPQTAVTADGVAAAASGDASGGDSILSTMLVGPGTLSWSWRLETAGGSGIDLEVDGTTRCYIEGDQAGAWIQKSLEITGAGSHEVSFLFWNEMDTAEDRGYLDCVSWTGAAAVPGATATTPAPVPLDWLVSHGLAAEGATDAEFEAAALATAENGRPVWECFVAGLDPTTKDDFRVFIDMDGGEPVVTWWPSNVAGRVYAVWGKADLTDEWSCPVEPSHRFYQVRVALVSASGVDERAWPGSVVVTFDPAGGTVDPATRTYDAPGALGQLPVPVRDGYDFFGWRTSATGGLPADETTAVPWCDWTLVAMWRDPLARALNPALVFTKGGSAEWFVQNDDTHDGVSAARSGAIADGQGTWIETTVTGPGSVSFWWNVSSEADCDRLHFYVDGSQQSDISGIGGTWAQKVFMVSGAGDHVLRWTYSKNGSVSAGSDCGWVDEVAWTPDVFTLRFDANGGSAVEPITAPYGTALAAPSAPTQDGYTFAGWSPAFPATMPLGGVTLTAQWTPRNYTISFDSVGGSDVAPITAAYGSALTAPSAPTRDGYAFAGWSPAFPATMPLGGATLTAQWTPRNYTVSFDSAGGSAVASITAAYGSALTAPSAPTRDGYTFAGWSPAFPATMPLGGATLTAQWTPRNYTVSFDSAGGSAVASITAPYGSALTAPSAPTRDGYMFVGWSPAFPATMPLGGVTLTAQWTPEGVLSWTVSDGTVTITGTLQELIGDLVIPAEIEGLPVTHIGNYAFENCSGLTSVTIPDSVTSIGNSAFDHCRGLTSISIPDSVTRIGDYAFYGCSGLTSVTIGNGVTSIGEWAFSGCSRLTSITIPDSVTSIGDSAFSGCSGLVEMTLPFVGSQRGCSGRKEDLFGYIFGTASYSGGFRTSQYYGSSYSYNYIPASLRRVAITDETVLGYGAFSDCSKLTSITIPDGVTNIGSYAFKGCSRMASITIPDGVTSIGYRAFHECSGLTSITIPDSVTSIEGETFSGCSWLTSVTIPDSVTSIGASAFSGCSGLTSITIPDSVTSIGSSAFYNCSGLTSVTIPDSVTNIGSAAFYNSSGLTFCVNESHPTYSTRNGLLLSKDGKTFIFGVNDVVTIPDGVTNIGNYAFENCSGLTSVAIPDSVASIGNHAFANCLGLTSITIPGSVTSIGNYAFYGCSGLTSVTIPDSVTSIGGWAFYDCSKLTSLSLPGRFRGNTSNMGIPSGCTVVFRDE